MPDIWIDPTELKSTAGLLGQQAQRINEAIADAQGCCGADVPRSMVGWIDEALVTLTEDALRVAIAYVTDAVGLAVRANEVAADQSVDTTTGTATQVDPAAAIIAGGSVVGGTGPAFTTDLPPGGINLTATVGNPTWADLPLMAALQGGTGAGMSPDVASALMNINQSQSDMIGTILAPNGLTMDDGKLVDSGGRTGGYADVVEDPYRPGSYDIEP